MSSLVLLAGKMMEEDVSSDRYTVKSIYVSRYVKEKSMCYLHDRFPIRGPTTDGVESVLAL